MQQMLYNPTRAQDRDGNSVLAIVLHEVNEPMSYIDAVTQQNASFPTAAHQSFHFSVDAANVHAYMPASMAALAIADTDTMAPWSIALANHGIDADLYTVNIAVSIGTAAPVSDPCTPGCGRTFPHALQHNLQVLLNNLATELELDIKAADVVWKHGAELCDLDIAPLLLPLPVVTPTGEDYLCDQLAALPTGNNPAPLLVGADCALYARDDGDWIVAANGGRHTPTSSANGVNAFAAGEGNAANGNRCAVGGGQNNTATNNFSTVAGGFNNQAITSSSVGGGLSNVAIGVSTVAGGQNNTANGGGGGYATVGGGTGNVTNGSGATIAGGISNTATGERVAILGGQDNNTNNLASAMIVGNGITARLTNALHCNRLVITQIPTSPVGLPNGAIWSNGGTLNIVSGV